MLRSQDVAPDYEVPLRREEIGRSGKRHKAIRSPAGHALLALAMALVLFLPDAASAQSIVGRVVDEARGRPIVGAAVALVDEDGDEFSRTITDATGKFVVTPPEAGEYHLAAFSLGYLPVRTPLIALTTEGMAEVDLLMQPAPIGLEGLEVSVDVSAEAASQLEIAGVSPAQLGNRWIDRAAVEAIPVKRDVGSVLEHQQIGGVRIIRPENMVPGSDPLGLCITNQRARTFAGQGRCMMGVVNGIPQSNQALLDLDPETVEAMAVLTPIEGSFMYGAQGEAGVVMIWTRRR